jgi:hypothetical protein
MVPHWGAGVARDGSWVSVAVGGNTPVATTAYVQRTREGLRFALNSVDDYDG